MSCDICGRGNCCVNFHSIEEQEKYEEVIDLFERARNLRDKVRHQVEDDELESQDD